MLIKSPDHYAGVANDGVAQRSRHNDACATGLHITSAVNAFVLKFQQFGTITDPLHAHRGNVRTLSQHIHLLHQCDLLGASTCTVDEVHVLDSQEWDNCQHNITI